MASVVAATTAGMETDVFGTRLDCLLDSEIDAVTTDRPRPTVKNEILPGFHHTDFVEVIKNSAQPD